MCSDCEQQGKPTLASEVHHVIKRRHRPDLTFARGNLLSLCKPCHSKRTRRGE
ncbi:MAG: HNH endonuclease [Gammaproteobacteria bacterium]|nr:HNH endonuclease [Gammaproteobacteria bacterium]